MDPITLATVTSGVTTLAWEVAKGTAGEAGKSAWDKIKGWFKWSDARQVEELAPTVAGTLQSKPELATQVIEALQTSSPATAARIASVINAKTLELVGQKSTGRDSFEFKAEKITFQGGQRFGGG